jgi:hypothetical protein
MNRPRKKADFDLPCVGPGSLRKRRATRGSSETSNVEKTEEEIADGTPDGRGLRGRLCF